MIITKSSNKRLSLPPPSLSAIISSLSLPSSLSETASNSLFPWIWPKSDLFHWIPVLNSFDLLLAEITATYDLLKLQQSPFTPIHKMQLTQILTISITLWDNCTNRNLYSSYEHLSALLNTTDPDILVLVLKLLIKPAYRLSSQRSLKQYFTPIQERITVLAQAFSTFTDFQIFTNSFDSSVPEELSCLKFQFYKLSSKTSESGGLVSILTPDIHKLMESEVQVLENHIQKFNLPLEHHFNLFHKIRIAKNIHNLKSRQILMEIRLLSLAICFNIYNHETAQSKFFLYEPDLVQKLATFVQENCNFPLEIQTAALYALECVSHYRHKLAEVLTATNASVNHGILLSLVRKITSTSNYPLEYLEAVYGLVGYIISTQSGGTMLITAGIVPILLNTLNDVDNNQLKNVTKCASLLDNILYGFTTSFNVFMNANGLEIVVSRIEKEVLYSINIINSNSDTTQNIPFERTALLRALLKFVMHMMQTSGNADRMRTLIDTSIPQSILSIFKFSKEFGPSVYGIAVNIMSTFIHNEPTSLNILQESKLPQEFLSSISLEMPMSAEVISAIPNAFGAICLNSAGLESFNSSKPIGTYLQLFTNKNHLRSLQDNDVPHLVGNSMDELIRHHPSLKEDIMTAIVEMLKRVVEMSESAPLDEIEKCALQLAKTESDMTDIASDKKESELSTIVDIAARFLEGLFQNVAHCRDFIRLGGAQLLLKLYSLPTISFDFSSSHSSFSLSYLFRVMVEGNSVEISDMIAKQTLLVLKDLKPLLEFDKNSSLLENFIRLSTSSNPEVISQGQKIFRDLITALGYIRLLSDIYCTHALSHSKSFNSILRTFDCDDGKQLMLLFGQLQRVCILEKRILKENIPSSWYQKPKKETPADPNLRIVGVGAQTSSTMDVDVSITINTPTDENPNSATAETLDPTNPSEKSLKTNSQMIWFLLSEIPSVLSGLIKGTVKLLWARKIADLSNRVICQRITEDIVKSLHDHLTWDRIAVSDDHSKTDYLQSVLKIFLSLLIDDRNGNTLQTHVYILFTKHNCLSQMLELATKTWNILVSFSTDDSTNKKTLVLKENYQLIMEKCFEVLTLFCSDKLIMESGHTAALIKEKEKNSEAFDPHSHLIDMRFKILPVVLKMWDSNSIAKISSPLVKSLIQIITQIMKAEGEVSVKNKIIAAPLSNNPLSSLAASLFGARQSQQAVVPDPLKVQNIVEMGFPRAAAERALIWAGNNVSRATEYLIMNPGVVAEASFVPVASASVAVPTPETPAVIAIGIESVTATDTDIIMADSVDEDVEMENNELAEALALSEIPNNDISNPLPTETAKGKEKELDQASKKDLDLLRENCKTQIFNLCFEVLVSVPSAIFELRNLICVLEKKVYTIITRIMACISQIRASDSAFKISIIATYLRVLALITSDLRYQIDAVKAIQPFITNIIEMAQDSSVDGVWISSIFLIMESCLSLSDEPKRALLDSSFTVDSKFLKSKEIKSIESNDAENNGNTEAAPDSDFSNILTMEQKSGLLDDVLRFMKSDSIGKDLLHALLRILVRLTRSFELATQFVQKEGCTLLFKEEFLALFPGQEQLTIMILRHLIEDPKILIDLFQRDIELWFANNRPRAVDINSFIRNFSYMACRNPEIFAKATFETCKLSKYDPFGRHFNLIIKPKNADVELEKTNDVAMPDTVSPEVTISKSITDTYDNVHSLMKSIVNDLLSIRALTKSKLSSKSLENSAENVPPEIETKVEDASSEDKLHIRRCFLLQCLSELLISYPECRKEVMNITQRKISKTPTKNIHKNSFLNYLLGDLLYCDINFMDSETLTNADMKTKNKLSENTWASTVICGLCISNHSDLEIDKQYISDIANTRKIVLEALSKSLKDSITQSFATIEEKYGRYIALVEVIHQILSYKSSSAKTLGFARSNKMEDDHYLQIAKIMLEKGFVTHLSSIIADLDVHHPLSKNLMTKLLKPVELLTKVSIKINEIPENQVEQSAAKSLVGETPLNHTNPLELEENGELSNIYRNSALSMFGPQSDHEDIDVTSEDESDQGFDEFTEGETEDEEDDQASETDDEMEIVVPEPFHGAHDDEMMEESSDEDDEDESVDNLNPHAGDEWVDVDESVSSDEEDEEAMDHHNIMQDLMEGQEIIDDEDEEDEEEYEGVHNAENQAQANNDLVQEDDFEEMDEEDSDEENDLEHQMELHFDELDNMDPEEMHDELFRNMQTSMGRIDRRRIMELDMGPDGLEIHFANGNRSSDAIRSNANEETFTHPLLVPNAEVARPSDTRPTTGGIARNGGRPGRAEEMVDWQAFDDAMGGNALQILEQIFSRSRAAGGAFRITEVPGGAGGVSTSGGMVAGISTRPAVIQAASSSEALDVAVVQEEPVVTNDDGQLNLLHNFKLSGTLERWKQEMKMMYGTSCHEKALRILNYLLNLLVPAAKEEDAIRKRKEEKEAEERKIESEKRKKEEEERIKQEEELKKELKIEEQKMMETDEKLKEEEVASAADDVSNAPAQPAASVEPERVIVIVNGNSVDITGTGIDVTFLEALPDDLRQEVISQHFREQQNALRLPEPESTTINQEFLLALPEEIREELLRQERLEAERLENRREPTTQPIEPAAQASPSRSRMGMSSMRNRVSRNIAGATASPKVLESKRPSVKKDTIQLLDKSALISLVRLIFVPDSVSNASLYRIFVNVSENSKTRNDLLLLLLSILAEGSSDLASVDKNFSQLSTANKKTKPSFSTPKKTSYISQESLNAITTSESVPNLVAQRCLDAFTQLVNFNTLVVEYLLQENENLTQMKTPKSASRKGKSKEKLQYFAPKYPVIILLDLLDRPYFLENSNLLEQLMSLLSNVFKYLGKPKSLKVDSPVEIAPVVLAETASTSTPTTTPSKPNKKNSSETISKVPAIPEHNLKSFVHVLRDGACSSKTFQYTLTVIQSLSKVIEFREVIANELVYSAQKLGLAVTEELKTLVNAFSTLSSPNEMDSKYLSVFSSNSAQQAKLLRLLKAVDFIHSKTNPQESTLSIENAVSTPVKPADIISTPLPATKITDSQIIYDKVQFASIWEKLGQVLEIINEKADLMHIATVLLPLIESFMVVSKPYVQQKKLSVAAASSKLSFSRQPSSLEPANYDLFVNFTEKHRKILNTMVRNNPSLMGGSFSLLVDNPKILEFDNKRTYFNQQLHKKNGRESFGSLQINVRRQYVFEDSYHQLQGRSGDEVRYSKLNVRFHEEEGVDAGGVAREWFSVLARQMFNPDYALFRPSAADKVTYQPNRASGINPDHLSFFKFVGRIIGKAIYDGRLLDCYFTRSFYKCMLGIEVDYKDMEAIDPEFHKSLEWILQNDITDILDLTFIYEMDDFGRQKVVELIPNGKNVAVSEENKHDYVRLTVQQRLVVVIEDQIKAFLTGFHDIIPQELIKIFNEQEMELLISGLPDIDIDDWKNNTEYQNFTPSSPQIQWFWRAVRSFSQEERAKLIQFVTGTSKVPLEGFSHLQGSSGVQKFQIHKDFGNIQRLPSAHTCFNQLDLPMYESYEQLRTNLLISTSECGTGFGFA